MSAARLKFAIDDMAGRYAEACVVRARVQPGTDAHAAACRRTRRQYRALMRLTSALAELAVGGTR
ncbi:hypothetical protein [Micromonospora sp. LOL_024]|uniref:hypothetical protein n=1 Tax=Micromonospora sp. LOL_024 TaxID=3345412 RepID=UPI003A858EA4